MDRDRNFKVDNTFQGFQLSKYKKSHYLNFLTKNDIFYNVFTKIH